MSNKLSATGGPELSVIQGDGALRVAALHPAAGALTEGEGAMHLVHNATTPEHVQPVGEIDGMLLELAWLGKDPVGTVREIRDRSRCDAILVTYLYCSRKVRQQLESLDGVRMLAGPLMGADLRRELARSVHAARTRLRGEVAPPRYTRAQLTKLLDVESTVVCECPNHVAKLLIGLQEFEAYSQECIVQGAEDEALHRDLAHGTGRMRTEMEALLSRVLAFDGIELD